jgi:hypothetical protein
MIAGKAGDHQPIAEHSAVQAQEDSRALFLPALRTATFVDRD